MDPRTHESKAQSRYGREFDWRDQGCPDQGAPSARVQTGDVNVQEAEWQFMIKQLYGNAHLKRIQGFLRRNASHDRLQLRHS